MDMPASMSATKPLAVGGAAKLIRGEVQLPFVPPFDTVMLDTALLVSTAVAAAPVHCVIVTTGIAAYNPPLVRANELELAPVTNVPPDGVSVPVAVEDVGGVEGVRVTVAGVE